MVLNFPEKFIVENLSPELALRYVDLVGKNTVQGLDETEENELANLTENLVNSSAQLSTGNLKDFVDLGQLRFVTEALGDNILKGDTLAIRAGNNILKEAGFPGSIVPLGNKLAVQNEITGEFIGINPEGFDTSDFGGFVGNAVDALPLVGTVAGLPFGGVGSGVGGIAGGIGAQAVKESLEKEFIPDRQNLSGVDIAAAGAGEAGLNALGVGATRLASRAAPILNVAKPAFRALPAGAQEVIETGVRGTAKLVDDALSKLPAPNKALDNAVQNVPLAPFIGVDNLANESVEGGIRAGLNADQIQNRVQSNFGLSGVNKEQSQALQQQAREALDAGDSFLNEITNIDRTLIDNVSNKLNTKVAKAQLQDQATKDLEGLFSFVGDEPALGREIQERIVKTWTDGVAAERLGFEGATEAAKREGGQAAVDVTRVTDIITRAKEKAPEVMRGINPQFTSSDQALLLGRRLSDAINSGNLSNSEFGILSKARGVLISDEDSVFRAAAQQSPAIQSFLDSSAARVARNDAIQGKFFDSIVGKKADLTTGQAARNLVPAQKAFDNFIKFKRDDPVDFKNLVEFTNIDEDLLDRATTAHVKQVFLKSNRDAGKALKTLANDRVVDTPTSIKALGDLDQIASGVSSIKDFEKATLDDVVKGISKGDESGVARANEILDFAEASPQERQALFRAKFIADADPDGAMNSIFASGPKTRFRDVAKNLKGASFTDQAAPNRFGGFGDQVAGDIETINRLAEAEQLFDDSIKFENIAGQNIERGTKFDTIGDIATAPINQARLGVQGFLAGGSPRSLNSAPAQTALRVARDAGDVANQQTNFTTEDVRKKAKKINIQPNSAFPEPDPLASLLSGLNK